MTRRMLMLAMLVIVMLAAIAAIGGSVHDYRFAGNVGEYRVNG